MPCFALPLFSYVKWCAIFVTFQVIGEIEEVVKTGIWVGDCFIYTNSVNRLNYYVGGEIVTVAHLDRWDVIHIYNVGV
jgi:hypothetical protein